MKVLKVNGLNLTALVLLFLFTLSNNSVFAQDDWSTGGWEDSGDSWGDEEESTDTAAATDEWGDGGDSWGDGGFDDFSYDEEEEEEPVIVKKPYERIEVPYDSVREEVSYQGVVEVLDNDGYEYEIDTIMYRARTWMEEEFGKKELKDLIIVDQFNNSPNISEMEYKIILAGSFPCMTEHNDFAKTQNGEIQFRMEIRVREGRYRYKINNLVHVAPVRAGEKEGAKTYFEYLRKSEDNIRYNDSILRAADTKITAMVDALESECHNNPILEEDDW